MAQQWALIGNIVITCAYAAITVAIVVPVVRAGQLFTNRLAVATAMIFFSCAVGHAFHAAMYWEASWTTATMTGMHQETTTWSLWPSAAWDLFTAAVGVYYWTLRRSYGVLLSGTGSLFVGPQEQQRRHDIELREKVAEGRAQAEAERDAQAAMLRAVITNSQSSIYVKDLQGRYLLANEAFQGAFGVTEAELLGHTDEYLDPVLAPVWRANDRLAHAGAVHVEETSDVDGNTRVYETNKFPLFDAAGELYAICGVSLDVTDLRKARDSAEEARDEALAQSRIKSEFLATMSHEIRTPMNGVLGLASLLIGTELDADQRRYASGIHSAGNALLGVINDILDYSKIEAGKVVLDPDDFDLGALLAETAALVTPAAEDKGLTVVTRRGPDLPATVRGDGGRVRQILLNLAGNAVKFTSKGSVTLRAALVDATGPRVRFEVTDTGIGITVADADRLFEPFTQADASTTRTYGGTGLGLAISRQLTEAMGGVIGVDSEPGQGSTFWCEIPFEPAQGTAGTPCPDATGLRILLVGTGPDHEELEADLRRWHMIVSGAGTGPAAMAALREAAAHGRPYDLLLLDADPGDVDTAGLSRAVAADPSIPAAHVVVLNENAPADPRNSATYLPKPVHRSALFDLLAQSMAAVVPVPVVTRPPAPSKPAGKGTILLVEDNDINQMVAVGVLASLGYRADVAGDGVQALELAGTRRYDAILMDCRMPRMDGFTATAELRRREAAGAARTPIIAMTASALVADRERCLAAGMDDYLAKPVNPAELDATLDRWVHGNPAVPVLPEVVAGHQEDRIGRRLDELAGDRTQPERDLVNRLVESFLKRAPQHVAALAEAYASGDRSTFEDQAHSLKGAAGNIGASAVADLCEQLEDEARAGALSPDTPRTLDRLREELRWTERRLRLVLAH
ncbi:ATP-binding protein [Actinoplanes friuliensis]|uniref:Circadian input-output histidine kinase CikA n=1 Tax=Actinoplanes friuliensis DSM 7358 TaxID=1246995 RepID=U5W088_9ACTN|nr:ATP-binding protein [Actinoplanes friuliensis]AGZ42623.1 putative multi-sensor signal transduction histidine kinase [Actinoplanes friuliensis DSM 7358]